MGELTVGSVLAGYRIDAIAGRGGIGVVYRATQLALERMVALKVIAPQFASDASRPACCFARERGPVRPS